MARDISELKASLLPPEDRRSLGARTQNENRFLSLPMWSPSRHVDLAEWVNTLLGQAREIYPGDARAEIAALAYALGASLRIEENLDQLPEGINPDELSDVLFALAAPEDQTS